MVEFINERTGGRFFVHESRVEEYKAMGHTIASSVVEAEAIKEKPVAAVKKRARGK